VDGRQRTSSRISLDAQPQSSNRKDRLWLDIQGEWVSLGLDPSFLNSVEYWAGIRGVHPLDHFLGVAHRALIGGIEL